MILSVHPYILTLTYNPHPPWLHEVSPLLELDDGGDSLAWIRVETTQVGGGGENRSEGPWVMGIAWRPFRGADIALGLVTQTRRLFVGASRRLWVIDLLGKQVISNRPARAFQRFRVLADGALGVDRYELTFFAGTGQLRWSLPLTPPWDYTVDRGFIRVVPAEGESLMFPVVTGPSGTG